MQTLLKYWPLFQDVIRQSTALDACWNTAISSYNCQTPYKARHGRGLLFHWCLSLLGGSRLSTTLLRVFFPLRLSLHLLLEHLHEAAVVGERVAAGPRSEAPGPRRGAAGGGRGAAAAGVAAAAARLGFAARALWIHVARCGGSSRVRVRSPRSAALLPSWP